MEPSLWPDLAGRRVLLAISGGIAAYKSAELCRLLGRCGAVVRVAMTAAARHFVGEATFAALSGHRVATELFDPVQEDQIGHIALADEAELLLIAPATADLLAKLAAGLAPDLVTTAYLAHEGPVLLAPAMNVHMWNHPATRTNVTTLRGRGHLFVGPEQGAMACGHVGAGRMAEPEQILLAAGQALAPQDLAGRRVMVSAGATREPLDPVRFISNHSTGKMGFAVAIEAAARGAEVVLVAGPTALPGPPGVERVDVTTAAEMAAAIEGRAAEQDAVVMTAAVADFRPRDRAATKLKKDALPDEPTIALERTTDILAALGQRFGAGARPLLVGFAAETAGPLETLARAKLERKGCHLLVANDVSGDDAGFGADDNRVLIVDREGGSHPVPLARKRVIAAAIVDRIARICGSGDG